MAEKILGIVLSDGTVLDATALGMISITDSGNVQFVTPDGAKLNLEPSDNLAIKPGGKVQLDTNHYADDADKDEFKIAAICDKKSKVEGLKVEAAGLKFVTENADATRGWDKGVFKMMFKEKTGATDKWAKLNLHAASVDIRGRSTGPGTGGGHAFQIAGVDSNHHENKLKFESDRQSPIGADNPAYNGEGGKGLEFGTFNNEHTSLYTGDYRFKADGRVYPATRGELVTDPITGKVDYPTQDDDFKDIISNAVGSSATWAEIVDAAVFISKYKTDIKNLIDYAKSQGWIPSVEASNPMPFDEE